MKWYFRETKEMSLSVSTRIALCAIEIFLRKRGLPHPSPPDKGRYFENENLLHAR